MLYCNLLYFSSYKSYKYQLIIIVALFHYIIFLGSNEANVKLNLSVCLSDSQSVTLGGLCDFLGWYSICVDGFFL